MSILKEQALVQQVELVDHLLSEKRKKKYEKTINYSNRFWNS